MSRAKRKAAIKKLEEARGTRVISYVTSTRANAESQMAMDVIKPVFDNLKALGLDQKSQVDLFLHSNGGEGIVPWRLVSLIREFSDTFCVLVPNRAFSAATLTALGADQVIMHAMGMLGPTDPTVANHFNPPNPNAPNQQLGISVEDVASYIALVKEDVGIHHEDELVQAFAALADKVHPLALGNVKRSSLQSRMMGEKLLHARKGEKLADHIIREIVDKLTSQLYFHGHPINRREAREDVGLTFVQDAEPPVEAAMWDLYSLYEQDMLLSKPFEPQIEAINASPLPVPAAPVGAMVAPSMALVPIGIGPTVIVESAVRSDYYEVDCEVTLQRAPNGAYSSAIGVTRQEWLAST